MYSMVEGSGETLIIHSLITGEVLYEIPAKDGSIDQEIYDRRAYALSTNPNVNAFARQLRALKKQKDDMAIQLNLEKQMAAWNSWVQQIHQEEQKKLFELSKQKSILNLSTSEPQTQLNVRPALEQKNEYLDLRQQLLNPLSGISVSDTGVASKRHTTEPIENNHIKERKRFKSQDFIQRKSETSVTLNGNTGENKFSELAANNSLEMTLRSLSADHNSKQNDLYVNNGIMEKIFNNSGESSVSLKTPKMIEEMGEQKENQLKLQELIENELIQSFNKYKNIFQSIKNMKVNCPQEKMVWKAFSPLLIIQEAVKAYAEYPNFYPLDLSTETIFADLINELKEEDKQITNDQNYIQSFQQNNEDSNYLHQTVTCHSYEQRNDSNLNDKGMDYKGNGIPSQKLSIHSAANIGESETITQDQDRGCQKAEIQKTSQGIQTEEVFPNDENTEGGSNKLGRTVTISAEDYDSMNKEDLLKLLRKRSSENSNSKYLKVTIPFTEYDRELSTRKSQNRSHQGKSKAEIETMNYKIENEKYLEKMEKRPEDVQKPEAGIEPKYQTASFHERNFSEFQNYPGTNDIEAKQMQMQMQMQILPPTSRPIADQCLDIHQYLRDKQQMEQGHMQQQSEAFLNNQENSWENFTGAGKSQSNSYSGNGGNDAGFKNQLEQMTLLEKIKQKENEQRAGILQMQQNQINFVQQQQYYLHQQQSIQQNKAIQNPQVNQMQIVKPSSSERPNISQSMIGFSNFPCLNLTGENLPECRIKRTYTCLFCESCKTQNPRLYLLHLRVIHQRTNTIYMCPDCQYATQRCQKLVRHMKSIHSFEDALERAQSLGCKLTYDAWRKSRKT